MAGLAGLATLAGAGVNFLSSYINRKNDLSMLKYQNEYNSPKNMMKRLLEAGINPNAAAQSIAGAPGYGNMAPADASNVSSLMPSDLGSALGQSVNNALTADLIKSNIEKNKETTRGQKIQNDYEETTFETRVQEAQDRGAITASEAKNAKYLAEKYPEMIDMSIEQQRAEIDKIKSEKTKIDKEVDKIDQDIKESNKRIEKLEQDIKTAKSQEALNYAQAALTKAKEENQKLLNDKQEMENRREELTGNATGVSAAYFDIEKREGTEAADEWLEKNNEVVGKVIKNSSKASAEGQQEVYDETPQGQLKRQYQEQMNKELAAQDERIAKARRELKTAPSYMKSRWEDEIKWAEKKKGEIRDKYSKKIAEVDKGAKSSVGVNVAGYGVNISE